jgi:hypothetical protein
VTKKRDRERDIVRELQEDAKWSMWTNTFGRQRGWGRPRSLRYGPGLRTYMLAAVLILGTEVAAIGLSDRQGLQDPGSRSAGVTRRGVDGLGATLLVAHATTGCGAASRRSPFDHGVTLSH